MLQGLNIWSNILYWIFYEQLCQFVYHDYWINKTIWLRSCGAVYLTDGGFDDQGLLGFAWTVTFLGL